MTLVFWLKEKIISFTFQDEASESRMRAACLIEEVQRLLDRQSGLYSVYSDAIHKYKSSKDITAFANARKKLDGDYRSISNQIVQVQASLNKEQPESAEKVSLLWWRLVVFDHIDIECMTWAQNVSEKKLTNYIRVSCLKLGGH